MSASARWSDHLGHRFARLAPAAAALLLFAGRLASAAEPKSLLAALTEHEFSPESTTNIPISTVSVWMKRLLSQDNTLPADVLRAVKPDDTIAVSPVRDWLNAQRFQRVVVEHCSKGARCDVNEVDEKYGLTAMHVASATGDAPLMRWLIENGGDVDAMDSAGRKPTNMTYQNFIANSKKWARAAGRNHCDLPEVVFADDASPDELAHARSEVRRLVGEGEPILMRGVLKHYAPELMSGWDIKQFVADHGHAIVTVGAVPYAAAFDLKSSKMTLREFYERYMLDSESPPLYVFDHDSGVNRGGYDAVVAILRDMFPIPSLIADPEDAGGLDDIHFSLGRPKSGAPFHIHADAVNAVVKGRKRWFVYTPARTLYSRRPIQEWLDIDYKALEEEEKPLECVQNAGDMVYIPLDWGHAVVNENEDTFGYALELLNKRGTYLNLRGERARDEL